MSDYLANLYSISKDGDISVTNGIPYVRVNGEWLQILIGNRKSLIISDLLEEYKDDPFFQDLYEKYCDLEKEVLMRYKLRKTEEENGNSELSKSTR